MVNYPLVSICIPTFNGEKYLEEALKSVLEQTYKNIEVIFSDDSSTDRTLSIIKDFKQGVSFPVLIINHKPAGIGANWNNCISNARGEYVKFLFQDDILFPTCIEELLDALTSNPQVSMAGSKRSILVTGELKEEHKKWLEINGDLQANLHSGEGGNYLLDKNFLKHKDLLKNPKNKIGEPTTVLIRKSIFEQIGYFKEDLIQILDFEFYYRLLKHSQILILNKELAAFRLHPEQASSKNKNKHDSDYEKYYRILYKDFFWYLNEKQQKKLLKKYNWFGKLYTRFKYGA